MQFSPARQCSSENCDKPPGFYAISAQLQEPIVPLITEDKGGTISNSNGNESQNDQTRASLHDKRKMIKEKPRFPLFKAGLNKPSPEW